MGFYWSYTLLLELPIQDFLSRKNFCTSESFKASSGPEGMDLNGSGRDGIYTQPQTTLHTHEGAIVEHLDKEGGGEEREEEKRGKRRKEAGEEEKKERKRRRRWMGRGGGKEEEDGKGRREGGGGWEGEDGKGGKRGGGGGGRRKERGGRSQSTHMYMVRIIPRLVYTCVNDMQLAVVCGKIHMTVCNLQTTFMSRKCYIHVLLPLK